MSVARLTLMAALGCLLGVATAAADVPAQLQVRTAAWDDGNSGGKDVQGHASFRIGTGVLRQCDGTSQVLAIRFNRRTAPLINQVQAGQPLNLDQQVKAAGTDGLRKTVCDAKGDFRFERMAAGFWYVWTQLPMLTADKAGDGKATIAETTLGASPMETSSEAEAKTKEAAAVTGVLATFVVVGPATMNDIDLSADVVKLWPTWTETR
ncbi:MAG: hypothetical protein E6Q98_13360 [Rhodospirillaceae bacterium]|nr:MAG: hypothetical protein E6Q98_13360 [Rhodospirillaceae bacterium]